MAGTITCDAPDCDAPSDFLIGNMNNGDQLAFCGEHYVSFCAQFAAQATEAAATEPEPKSDEAPEHQSPEVEDAGEDEAPEASDD